MGIETFLSSVIPGSIAFESYQQDKLYKELEEMILSEETQETEEAQKRQEMLKMLQSKPSTFPQGLLLDLASYVPPLSLPLLLDNFNSTFYYGMCAIVLYFRYGTKKDLANLTDFIRTNTEKCRISIDDNQ